MERAIDQVSGRITEPYTLTEEMRGIKDDIGIGTTDTLIVISGIIWLVVNRLRFLNKILELKLNHLYSFICP